ncbi:MAG: hypothetical protein LBP96_03270, partial [Bacteroidales bacterium]|nr:hypothetical protein [Bacteroidales bacterium]
MKNFINIALFMFVCFPVKGVCQTEFRDDGDELKFVSVGFGAGGFRASKYVANYYNGDKNNVNKISYVLDNPYWREEIRQQQLNGRNFRLYELPNDMRYKISTAVHARFALNLSSHGSVFLQVNQVNLTAVGFFTIEVESPQLISEPDLLKCDIWGTEARSMVDIGFQRRYDLEARNWQWFYELAFNITSTKVKESKIKIRDFEQSILDRGAYTPGHPLYDPRLQSAMGVGLVGAFGVRYIVGTNASLDMGITTYLQ